MSSPPPLSETLQRLDALIGEKGHERSELPDMTATGRRMSGPAADTSRRPDVSECRGRQACDGKEVPGAELLHGLELPRNDTLFALMNRYVVKSTDLRVRGCLTRDQGERLREGVLRSVVPPEGDHQQ